MITYTDEMRVASPIPQLEISQDELLQSAIEKLAKAIVDIRGMLDREFYPAAAPVSTDAIKHEPGSISKGGSDADQFEGTKLKIETTRNDQDMSVTFKAVDFEIPAGSTLASSTVNVSGQRDKGRTEIINSKEPEMTLSVAYNRFPITLDSRVVITTASGDVELRKKLVINSDKSISQETPYEIVDRTIQSTPTTLQDLLVQFDTRLKSVEAAKKASLG